MTVVDVNRLRQILDALDHINGLPFDEIEWVEDGSPIAVSPEDVQEWKLTGLSNKDFLATGFIYGTKMYLPGEPESDSPLLALAHQTLTPDSARSLLAGAVADAINRGHDGGPGPHSR